MNLYVISTKYQPLVTVNRKLFCGKKTVSKKRISTHDLQTTFNASKMDTLIACDNKDDAIAVVCFLIKGHHTCPHLIEQGIRVFAVPVIYTIEVDLAALSSQTILTADDLLNYADITTIPLHSTDDGFNADEKCFMITRFQKYSRDISIRKLTGLQLAAVTDAHYLNVCATAIVEVNLRPVVTGLFSWFPCGMPATHTHARVAPIAH